MYYPGFNTSCLAYWLCKRENLSTSNFSQLLAKWLLHVYESNFRASQDTRQNCSPCFNFIYYVLFLVYLSAIPMNSQEISYID